MPETQKSSRSPGKSPEIALNKIDALEKKIECMAKAKRNTAIATYIGLSIIIIFIALFIFNIVSYVKNYNTVKFATALNSSAIGLAQSEEMQEVLEELRDKFIPALKCALIQKMQKDAPLFKRSTQELVADLKNYLQFQVKPKLTDSLIKELISPEVKMLITCSSGKSSLEKLNQITINSNQFLLENITKSIDFKLDKALSTLTALNNSFQMMYSNMENTPLLKGLTPDMTGEVENLLIETMLELIIYQLNPQKGNMPAFANGGAK